MNSLITLGTCAAFGYSLFVTVAPGAVPEELREVYYEAVGVILTLILLGQTLRGAGEGWHRRGDPHADRAAGQDRPGRSRR